LPSTATPTAWKYASGRSSAADRLYRRPFPEGDWQAGLLKAARLFQPYVPFDYLVMGLENDGQSNAFRSLSFLPHRPG
jgi:hypothetical protein